MPRSNGFCSVAFIVLGIAALTHTATAARPTFTDVDFSVTDPDLSEQCGFPVQVHLQGKLIDTQVANTFMTRGAG
jgi:hypothetical protein